MYYSEEEISNALFNARKVIDSRTEKVTEYTRNYNDCWALVKEYDKALRGTSLLDINFDYKTHEEFFEKIKYDLKELAEKAGYEIIKNERPKFGDIAYESLFGIGSAMIADNSWWVSTCEKNSGTKNRRKLYYIERRLLLLARPLRS